MYDAGKIIVGIVVFLVLATSPLWFNAMTAEGPGVPELKSPPNGATECVEARDTMRTNHITLLDQWRDDVVRLGRRDYVSATTGKVYDMSLSRTCMDCHSNKTEFCDACHNFMAVSPYCWDCHVEPKEAN
ncbi:MAG TPA: sulfate reduction electron transfer complex DsrMKJOP subunit DsrJ [Candidatus Sulfomarinibacteraceae bacterium]|nr:sulfate reduction electron transfer complex DsrMKJOP subunit DsrJ [Candidatus Sulfomarinibacteraceae bacterium]